MNKQIDEFKAVIEFRIARNKDFSVVVKAWQHDSKWQWNVYANIFETHELFNDPVKAFDTLPFHGGCTFDQLVEHNNSNCTKYSREDTKCLKLGSDYMHLHDNYDNHSSPFESIPYNILSDANELVEALKSVKEL